MTRVPSVSFTEDGHNSNTTIPSELMTDGGPYSYVSPSSLHSHIEWADLPNLGSQYPAMERFYDTTSSRMMTRSYSPGSWNPAPEETSSLLGRESGDLDATASQPYSDDGGLAITCQSYRSCGPYLPHSTGLSMASCLSQDEHTEYYHSNSRSPTVETMVSAGSSPFSGFESSFEILEMRIKRDTDDITSSCGKPAQEEPYAKLIYKALLSAPNHAMVLQEIYQWFAENTDKGKATTTGWRNSIRHNLSMNAAFRKTEQASSGEGCKKASVWVLDPAAVKNGVTPTTRYRKSGKKSSKSNSATARARQNREQARCQQAASTIGPCNMTPTTPADHYLPDMNAYHQSKTLIYDGLQPYDHFHAVRAEDGSLYLTEPYGTFDSRPPYAESVFTPHTYAW